MCRWMAWYGQPALLRELIGLSGRPRWDSETVHAEVFPAAAIAPDDDALRARWERLRDLREEVAKAMEEARQRRTIGSSLEAEITVDADPDTTAFLASFGEGLRFSFPTSGVRFGPAGEGAWRSSRLPQLARSLGDSMKEFKKATRELQEEDSLPAPGSEPRPELKQALSELREDEQKPPQA